MNSFMVLFCSSVRTLLVKQTILFFHFLQGKSFQTCENLQGQVAKTLQKRQPFETFPPNLSQTKFLYFYLDVFPFCSRTWQYHRAFCQCAHFPEPLHFCHLPFHRLTLWVQVPQVGAVFAPLLTPTCTCCTLGCELTSYVDFHLQPEGRVVLGFHHVCLGSINSTQPERSYIAKAALS